MNRVLAVDKNGRNYDGGLLLEPKCVEALRNVLARRCTRNSAALNGILLVDAVNELGEVILKEQGLEFEIKT